MGGKVRFNSAGAMGVWKDVTGTTVVNDGIWHHVAVTHDAMRGTVVIYVDGVQDAMGTLVYNANYATYDRIGAG